MAPIAAMNANVWTNTLQLQYERGRPAASRVPTPSPIPGDKTMSDRRIFRMNDTPGLLHAAHPAISLTGVNLSLGRGAARVHILKDIDLKIGRGEAIGMVGAS